MSGNTDYFNINLHLSEEQRLIQMATRDWVNKFVKPIIEEHFQKEETPTD